MLTIDRWHQDVKPKNILVKSSESKSRHQVQFVLADLGLSHFRQNVAGEEPRDTNTCGTRTYGDILETDRGLNDR